MGVEIWKGMEVGEDGVEAGGRKRKQDAGTGNRGKTGHWDVLGSRRAQRELLREEEAELIPEAKTYLLRTGKTQSCPGQYQ